MVEVIRNKWCDDLEELVSCPICMERPPTWICQCLNGHHICRDCRLQSKVCPTCGSGWSDARNFLGEKLCAKLDDIKLSLIDPENEVNKLLLPNRTSVASQTDIQAAEATSVPIRTNSHDHTGSYTCCIGSCNQSLSYELMMTHIKEDHSTQYMEMPMEGNVFQNMWFFDFVEQLSFDRAFTVPSIGTFFLKLSSDVFGNFIGFVLMLHNGYVSKKYTYQMEIACCPEHTTNTMSYTGEICSCRTPRGTLFARSLNIKRNEIQRLLEHKKNLTCTVLLSKNPHADDQDGSQKYAHPKKNYSKNRYNGPRQPQGNSRNGQPPRPLLADPVFRHPRPSNRPQSAPNGQQRGQASRDGSRQSRPRSPQRHTDPLGGPPPMRREYITPGIMTPDRGDRL